MNKLLFKTTIFVLIQLLVLGNIVIKTDSLCLAADRFFLAEEHNLSPRINIDNVILNNMFINGFPVLEPANYQQDYIAQDSNLMNRITNYALRKKKENEGKGIFRQNPVYLMLKSRIDRIEKRGTPYNVKAKQRKELLKDVNRLKKLFGERIKWIKPGLAKEYDTQINELERLLDAVQTQGDWDDLVALGIKLNKALLKHGRLAKELAVFSGTRKKKKLPNSVEKKEKPKKPITTAIQNQSEPAKEIQEESLPDPEQLKDELAAAELEIPEPDVLKKYLELNAGQLPKFILATGSRRKHVLEKAFEKLNEVYNLAYQDLPYEIAFAFQEKIDQLKQRIDAVQKGEFPALKQDLRALETDLVQAIADNNQAKAAAALRQIENIGIANPQNQDNQTPHVPKVKKPTEQVDSFAQAVTLYDPDKVKLRSLKDVINELQGQINLLDQIINAEMLNSMELPVYNARREADGLVIQINFSEALEKIEVGSDIIMDLRGKIYLFKCDKLLNSGGNLLLKPANKKGVFPDNFPQDISGGKFVYMPSTHSEDMQKKTLEAITNKIGGQNQSTGIKVLDYFLRIKSAARDIEEIDELKEAIAYTDGLDMFQKAAVNMIVKTKFGLILGPFGTGKTSVLLAGAKNIIFKNKKPVFIIAPQHKIADDITLKAGDCQIPVLRCGNNLSKFNPAVLNKYSRHSETGQIEFMRRYKQLNTSNEDNGCLFVGTDMGASFDWLINQLRDPESAAFLKDVTLIVDEAALINYPELITAIYMLRPDALILVGDHVQFSPYKLAARFSSRIMSSFRRNISKKAIYRYHISSFKELISMRFNKVNLLINYRNPWINVDLLQEWYKGVLNLQSISKQRGELIEEDTFVIEDTSTWEKQSFAEKYHYGNSFCNKTEALWILKRIKYFLAKGNIADDITIITYYNGQIRLISDLIDADGDISKADSLILKRNIFTPISFQGGENKILLASLVRSEADTTGMGASSTKKSNPVFLSEPEFAKAEALLVLLSRHKGKLGVIGNRDTLDALTKHRYQRINYLYSCLFKHKDKIKACLNIQNIELTSNRAADISRHDFIQSAI
ncbi:MAG: AAA domain-containing protein [Candidatus Omnitrophota bacterium]